MSSQEALMDTSEAASSTGDLQNPTEGPLDALLSKYEEVINRTQKISECLESKTTIRDADTLYASVKKALRDVLELEDDPAFKEHFTFISKMMEVAEKKVVRKLTGRPDQVMSLSSSVAATTASQDETRHGSLDGLTQKFGGSKARARANSRQMAIDATEIPKTDIMLKDVVGLDEAKKALQKVILLPLRMPELFEGRVNTWNHVLFYGPPGTGKTKLASAVANEANVPLLSISSADILSAYIGESEKMIQDLFAHAKNKKCIVFIDEIDSFCRRRSSKEAEHTRSLKNQLLLELDRNSSKENIVICATNCPWDIDSAFMRRFQCRLYVPLPDRHSRRKILENNTLGVPISMSHTDWDNLADRTHGYSGSDLTNVASFAIQEPISELISSEYWIQRREDKKWCPCSNNIPGSVKIQLSALSSNEVYMREVQLKDFIKGLEMTPKSVPSRELDKYMGFMSE